MRLIYQDIYLDAFVYSITTIAEYGVDASA